MTEVRTVEYLSDIHKIIPLVVGKKISGVRTEGGWPEFVFSDGSSICVYTPGEPIEAEYYHAS